MADELISDDERAEQIKKWWRENGTSIGAGIAIAVAGVFGWQQWQQHQIDQSEAASEQFQIAQAAETDKVKALRAVAEDFSSTPYAALASLTAASEASQDDPATAIEALKVAMNGKDTNVADIATLRLIRLYIAEGKLSEAKSLLDTDLAVAYTSLVEELRGDYYVAEKDLQKAREAYDKAILSAGNNPVRYLKMKRDNLGKGA
jgi:predicted negative regulator of RcsB-dependent stress response